MVEQKKKMINYSISRFMSGEYIIYHLDHDVDTGDFLTLVNGDVKDKLWPKTC